MTTQIAVNLKVGDQVEESHESKFTSPLPITCNSVSLDKRIKVVVNYLFAPQHVTAIIFETSIKNESYQTEAYAYIDRFETERYPLPVDLAWEVIEAKGLKRQRNSHPELALYR